MKNSKTVYALVESAIMIALATVLSVIKIVDMPAGGSVTLAAMLPLILIAYRHGTAWGLGAATAYAFLQSLLGLENFSYVTGWQSVVAVLVLDYLLAYVLVGLGGMFRSSFKTQKWALAAGAVLVCILRYACHTIAGATVWAGLSIPDSAALLYSLSYNATYMIPETIILVAVSIYLGDIIDFSRPVPTRTRAEKATGADGGLAPVAWLIFLCGFIADVIMTAPYFQKEDGTLGIENLADADWVAVIVVSAIAIAVGAGLLIYERVKKDSEK